MKLLTVLGLCLFAGIKVCGASNWREADHVIYGTVLSVYSEEVQGKAVELMAVEIGDSLKGANNKNVMITRHQFSSGVTASLSNKVPLPGDKGIFALKGNAEKNGTVFASELIAFVKDEHNGGVFFISDLFGAVADLVADNFEPIMLSTSEYEELKGIQVSFEVKYDGTGKVLDVKRTRGSSLKMVDDMVESELRVRLPTSPKWLINSKQIVTVNVGAQPIIDSDKLSGGKKGK